MPVFTLNDLNNPKGSSTPLIGRRLADFRPNFKAATPKTRSTETDKLTTKKAAGKERKISSKRKRKTDNNDSDEDYLPPGSDDDCDSDASTVMSVDAEELGDDITEKVSEDGKVIRSRGTVQDYTLVPNSVLSDEAWKESGAYHKQQWKAMLAEQKVNADAEVDDPDAPTVECDLQGLNDDPDANFGLQRAPDQTQAEFVASMKPDYVYQDGDKFYSPAYKKTIWKEKVKGKNGKDELRVKAADGLKIYPDGSIALRRRFDLETSATEGMRPNKRKRVEDDSKEGTE
ncbi:unnamed protein product [Alternaria alternata]